MTKIICFDVDGTLVPGNAWLYLSAHLGVDIDEHKALYKKVVDGVLPMTKAEPQLRNKYIKSGNATEKNIEKILKSIRPLPFAEELFKILRQRGYALYLVSGALDVFVESIGKKLGADGYYASSSLLYNKKGVLSQIISPIEQSELKVKTLEYLAKENNIPVTDIIFVGDSDNDIGAFTITGRGIAVGETPFELEARAWKKISSLEELPSFV